MPALDHPADPGADIGPPTHGPAVDRPAFDLGRVVGRWTARLRGRHAAIAIAIAIAAAIIVEALVLTVVVAPRIGTAPTDAPAPAARSGAAARTDLDRALDRLERAVRP
jgi:hypothetical protein